MATLALYGKLGANIFGGEIAGDSFAIDFLSDTIKAGLVTSTYTPDVDADEVWSTPQANEASGAGYAAVTLAGKTATYSAGSNKTVYDATDVAWTASGGTLTFRYVVFYKDSGVAGTSPLIGYLDAGAQSIPDGSTFTVQFDATNGVFYATSGT